VRAKKVESSEHGPRHVTPAGRSVFYDLFPAEKAAELEMRAQLMMGLERWLEKPRVTQAQAAKVLGVTQARVSDLKRGKINRFSMDLLVRLAARAGLKPKLKLAAHERTCRVRPMRLRELLLQLRQLGQVGHERDDFIGVHRQPVRVLPAGRPCVREEVLIPSSRHHRPES